MQLQEIVLEGHGQSQEPSTAAAVAMVLGNDDLLIEILLRLDSPTWLVRAAAVSKRWLRRASDPAFLRRFRAHHPPRILGLQVRERGTLPVPQPQELAAAARIALETIAKSRRAIDCRNGRIIFEIFAGNPVASVRSLLHPTTPRVPIHRWPCLGGVYDGLSCNEILSSVQMFLLEDHDASFLSLEMATDGKKVNAMFSILQSGAWCEPRSAVLDLQMVAEEGLQFPIVASRRRFAVGRKVYMEVARHVVGLDLATSSFFTLKLPDGVGHYKFSRAQHSGLYLIDATEFQLRVWYGDGLGQWVLEDTICVREACGHLNVQSWKPDDGCAPVLVVAAGDNAEFVFLKLVASEIICCMQLGNRVVDKMEWTLPDFTQDDAVPISMIWPPVFPAFDKPSQEH